MNIADIQEKCKARIGRLMASCREKKQKIPRDILIVLVLILASSASFMLGYLAGADAQKQQGSAVVEIVDKTEARGRVVASKNGTRYYLTSCAAADRISDANKIWFASQEAARAAGYAPAENCPGL